jgi:predicted Zn-dependent protease
MIAAAPDAPLGYYRLAQFYVAQKKNAAALEQLELASSKAPRDLDVLASIVKLLVVERKADQAIARVRRAVDAQPENALLQVMLGEGLMSYGKLDDAKASFLRAIELEPRLEAGYADLARLHLARNEMDEARAVLEKGMKANPPAVGLGLLDAEIDQRDGQVDQAIARYEALYAIAPGNDVVVNNLASLLSDHRSDAAARARAVALAQRFENSPNPLYLDTLGWALYQKGDAAKAADVLARALAARDLPVIQYHLGMALHKDGKVAEARKHLQRAAESEVAFPGRDEARALLVRG